MSELAVRLLIGFLVCTVFIVLVMAVSQYYENQIIKGKNKDLRKKLNESHEQTVKLTKIVDELLEERKKSKISREIAKAIVKNQEKSE